MTPENKRDEDLKKAEQVLLDFQNATRSWFRGESLDMDKRRETMIQILSTAFSEQRQSWEREKKELQARMMSLSEGTVDRIYVYEGSDREAEILNIMVAEITKLEAEKKGLEERVRELEIKLLIAQEKTERVRDEWREAKNGFLITDDVKAQELTRLKSRNEELERIIVCGECGGTDLVCAKGWQEERSRLNAENERLKNERDEARKYGEMMYSLSREITCVWCGYQFESKLGEQKENLQSHAEKCEKHPVKKLSEKITRLTASLAVAHEAIEQFDDLIRESKGVHGLHLNGDVAEWGWLYREWLSKLPFALSDKSGKQALERWKSLDVAKTEYDKAMNVCIDKFSDQKFGSVSDCLFGIYERWKRMEAVVEAARKHIKEPHGNHGDSYGMADLIEALEAFDASEGGVNV